MCFVVLEACIQISATVFMYCVTLGKLLGISGPFFSFCEMSIIATEQGYCEKTSENYLMTQTWGSVIVSFLSLDIQTVSP